MLVMHLMAKTLIRVAEILESTSLAVLLLKVVPEVELPLPAVGLPQVVMVSKTLSSLATLASRPKSTALEASSNHAVLYLR